MSATTKKQFNLHVRQGPTNPPVITLKLAQEGAAACASLVSQALEAVLSPLLMPPVPRPTSSSRIKYMSIRRRTSPHNEHNTTNTEEQIPWLQYWSNELALRMNHSMSHAASDHAREGNVQRSCPLLTSKFKNCVEALHTPLSGALYCTIDFDSEFTECSRVGQKFNTKAMPVNVIP